MKHPSTRRDFIKTGALAGAGFWLGTSTPLYSVPKSANEKLNIAVIGCGGKGHSDARGVSSENIVALCDVDERRGAQAFKDYPKAKKYHDFRVLFDKEKNLDAVVVSTPDHTHAAATAMALRRGMGAYTQKPLTHSIEEARILRDLARKHKVATQMGNQGTSMTGLRRGADAIRAGAIGEVKEVHVWTNRPVWPQGIKTKRPEHTSKVPSTLKWDLWLGPAQWRPYAEKKAGQSVYLPFDWRGWWDYGTGALGDMACHTANLVFMALELTYPTKCEIIRAEGLNPETAPDKSTLLLHFPARGNKPPVKFYWYDGGHKPPANLTEGLNIPNSGSLMVGEKGNLYSPNDYGARYELLPKDKFKDFKFEPKIPRSPGHYREWLNALKGGPAALSNFDYASQLTESILIGNVALRAGSTIEWDAKNMKVTNNPNAQQYVMRDYRKGWSLNM